MIQTYTGTKLTLYSTQTKKLISMSYKQRDKALSHIQTLYQTSTNYNGVSENH